MSTGGRATAPSTPSSASPAKLVLLVTVVLWILHTSLMPFELDSDRASMWGRVELGISENWIEHIIVFAILGVACALQLARLSATRVALSIGAVALVVELSQITVAGRHARLGDWTLGVLCAFLAYLATTRLARPMARRGPAPDSLRLVRSAFVIATLIGAVCTIGWYRGSELRTWDPAYPLVAGNEATGARPWRGDLFWVVLYPHGLEPEQAAALAKAPWRALVDDTVRNAHGPLAAYSFQPSRFGSEPSPVGTELVEGGAGLAMTERRGGGTTATFPGALASITNRLAASSSFALEAHIRVEDLRQFGPARIIGQSVDPQRRNFTLAQAGSSIVMRVRNGFSGPNGVDGQASWPDVLESDRPRHLVVSYDRGILRLFADGRPYGAPHSIIREVNRTTPGAGGRSAFLTLIWFAPLGALSHLAWGRRGPLAMAGSWLLLCSIDAYGALATGHALHASYPLSALLWSTVGGALAARARSAFDLGDPASPSTEAPPL